MSAEDLVSEISAPYYDNYILETADRIVVNGMRVGREHAAARFKVWGAEYSAYLDAHVCPLCAHLNGLQVKIDSDDYNTFCPPQHRGCRCIWVYVEKEEEGFEPDTDAYDRLQEFARTEGGGDVGRFLNRHTNENQDLQQRFEAEIEKARAEIRQRKVERIVKRMQEQTEAAAKEAAMTPKEKEARDRRREAAKKTAETKRDLANDAGYGPVRDRPPMTAEKKAIIDDLRLHVDRDTLRRADTEVRKAFGNSLDNVKRKLKEVIGGLPEEQLRLIQTSDSAKIRVVAELPAPYGKRPGQYIRASNEAIITAWGLQKDTGALEEELTHMLDHLLGSQGEGGMMSSGEEGITPAVQAFGRALVELYQDKTNKYSEYGDKSVQEFLAQWVRAYFTEKHADLREEASTMYNWLTSRWFNDDFWREMLQP